MVWVLLSLSSPGPQDLEVRVRKESPSTFAEMQEDAWKNCAERVTLAVICLDMGLSHSHAEVLGAQNVT